MTVLPDGWDRYRAKPWITLWVALVVNAVMFAAELYAGFASRSVSLRADALDFLGDAANYTISLAVVGLALQWRARAALVKGVTLVAFGGWVLVAAVLAALRGVPPEPRLMGVVGFFALIANLGVAVMLFRFRSGDSNMQSVWICSRNDALANIAVDAGAAATNASRHIADGKRATHQSRGPRTIVTHALDTPNRRASAARVMPGAESLNAQPHARRADTQRCPPKL